MLIQIGVDGSGDGAGQAVERKLIGRAALEFDLWVGLPVRDVHGQAVFGQGDFIDVEA